MNVASKALAQTLYGSDTVWQVFLGKRLFFLIILGAGVFFSGLAVVYSSDLNRCLYMALQTEQTEQEQLQKQYSQLLLEQTAWSTQARVEQVAINQLKMQTPDSKNIVLITQ